MERSTGLTKEVASNVAVAVLGDACRGVLEERSQETADALRTFLGPGRLRRVGGLFSNPRG